MRLQNIATFLFFGCALVASAQSRSSEKTWEWTVTPYAWAISTELDTSASLPGDGNSGAVRLDFSNLLDKLDFAAQLHFEGQRDQLGFLLDVTNLQLSDRTEQGQFQVDTDSNTTLIEAAVILGAIHGGTGTQLLVGLRSIMLDVELEIERTGQASTVREAAADVTLTDAMIGIRHQRALSEKWRVAIRGDVATGDTDFSWNASAIVGRNFGERGTLLVGYRYMNVEMKTEKDLLEPELTIDGPLIGYMFRF